jgi:hypothetical protein
MMALTDAIDRAAALASSGDPEGAATALGDARRHVDDEPDSAILLRYAVACRHWGPPEAEEAALRAVLHRGLTLDALERLLDLLQQKLDTVEGAAREAVVAECEHLGTRALELLAETSGVRWANLIHPRGLRRLELARMGRQDHVPGARADLEAHRSWLERNESVPTHMKRTNMMALADVELAELDLVDGQADVAVRRLESAIAALERAKAPKWWIDRAWSVLARALG